MLMPCRFWMIGATSHFFWAGSLFSLPHTTQNKNTGWLAGTSIYDECWMATMKKRQKKCRTRVSWKKVRTNQAVSVPLLSCFSFLYRSYASFHSSISTSLLVLSFFTVIVTVDVNDDNSSPSALKTFRMLHFWKRMRHAVSAKKKSFRWQRLAGWK